MHGKIHLAKPYCFSHFFLTIDHYLRTWSFLMPFDKFGALNKHATRTTGRVINPPVKWLYDINNKLASGCRSKKLSSSLSLRHGKLAEKVFINLSENISLNIHLYA